MNIRSRLKRISNSYYNIGLSRAKNRDLTGAITSLKRALLFYKKNNQARNLLGLCFFEMGEVADALVQWVVSVNIDPEDVRANLYLHRLRKRATYLEQVQIGLQKYNQARMQVAQGNDDLAILSLYNAIKEHSRYVRANLLLGLLYIQKEDTIKAKKALQEVLKIDRFNPKALQYMDIVKSRGRNENMPKVKIADAHSHKSMQDDDVIIPSTFRDYSGLQTVGSIVIGLLIGAASILFLYLPTTKSSLNNAHNAQLLQVEEQLNLANIRATRVASESEALKKQVEALSQSGIASNEDRLYQLAQYQLLLGIVNDFRSENYTHAAQLYAYLDRAELIDVEDGHGVSTLAILEDIEEKIAEDGHVLLTDVADALYGTGDYTQAIAYYDLALELNSTYAEAIYKKGLAYKAMGDIESANTLFGEVIIGYPDTEVAEKAKAERGY